MSKSAKKPSSAKSPLSVRAAKAASQPADEPKTNKADARSKQARVIAMLQSPTGTTIAAIMKATGWQPHSVRGFLAGVVRRRLKLTLASKKVNGHRIYQIASDDSGRTRQTA
jgi:outer membrane biosynthesis protein TonB